MKDTIIFGREKLITLFQLPVSSLVILVRTSGDKELIFFFCVISFPGALKSESFVYIKKEHCVSLNEGSNEAVFERAKPC